jgi:glycosyltransferase involved in cell wall biosynthesis
MQDSKYKVSVIIPAYNEESALKSWISELKPYQQKVNEIIIVDDGSTDNTAGIAEKNGFRVIRHKKNRGYGAALKSGIKVTDSHYVLMMDSDGQHAPQHMEMLLDYLGEHDMVVGQRTSTSGDYLHRVPGKKLIGIIANFLTKQKIPDLNSGLRLVRRDLVMENLGILPDGFSFSTTLTIALLKDGYNVKYVPFEARKREGRTSTVKFFQDGFNTILLILRAIMLFDPLRIFLPASAIQLLIGLLYVIIDCIVKNRLNIATGAVLLILSGVLTFFAGLIADQISFLRRGIK